MSKKVHKHGAALKVGDVTVKVCEHERDERCKTTGLSGEDIEQRLNAEVVYDDTSSSRSGPAAVNSDAFRNGWDRIFGQRGRARASA